MAKLLPFILALFGLGAGVGGGLMFRPDPLEHALLNPCGESASAKMAESMDAADQAPADNDDTDFIKLNNQFVVPVVRDGSVQALVVMSLSLELASGGPELVYQREPKLRDAILQVLFNHANSGGFDGNFTSGRNMDNLRLALRETASKALGTPVTAVLIVGVARQDA